MAQSLRIETLDRSGRWYLTPGSRSIYDLRVRNDTKNAADCSLVVEDPASGVTVDPRTFTLRGHEVRTVTVLFSEHANPTRAQRVLMTLRDDSGAELATFEHPLIVTGGTDCSITLSFKDVISEASELRGFSMACAVRSQSEAPATFQLSFTSHPAFAVPDLPALQLNPGEGAEVLIPVRWDRTVKDSFGLNHPRMLEVAIPVSNGKRTSRIRWDIIEEKLQSSARKSTAPSATPGSAHTNVSTPQPTAIRSPAPAASATQEPPMKVTASPRARVSSPAAVDAKPQAPLLMLNGQSALKCLPNPAAPHTTSATINGAAARPNAGAGLIAAASRTATVATPPAVPTQSIELSLFPGPATTTEPAPLSTNGKKAETPAAVSVKSPTIQAPAAQPAPAQTASQTPVSGAAPARDVAPAAATPAAWAATISPLAPAGSPAPTQPAAARPAAQAATMAQTVAQSAAPVQSPPPQQVSPQANPAAQVAAPKLTPYSPARWDLDDKLAAAIVAPVERAKPPAPSDVSTTPPPIAPTIRTRQIVTPVPVKRGVPAGILIGGLAVAAIAVAAILFKPGASTSTVSTNTVAIGTPIAAQNVVVPSQPVQLPAKHKAMATTHAKPKVVAATPAAQATSTPQPTPAPTAQATSRPATPKPATPKPAAAAPVQRKAAAVSAQPVRRQQLYQPASGAVVAIGGIEAYYGPRGRAVRVLWNSAEQASASVALIDEHGTTVSATSVRGSRQSALLYLPRRFHGSLTVQVSSIGRLGERVAQTTSLPAFGT